MRRIFPFPPFSSHDRYRYLNGGRFSSAPPEAVEMLPICPGVTICWPVDTGSFNETFPWPRIGDAPDSLSFNVEVHNKGSTVQAWSKQCNGDTHDDGEPCHECRKVHRRVEDLVSIAQEAKRHTNHRFLNFQQLRNLLNERIQDVQFWKLKVSCSGISTRMYINLSFIRR